LLSLHDSKPVSFLSLPPPQPCLEAPSQPTSLEHYASLSAFSPEYNRYRAIHFHKFSNNSQRLRPRRRS
jgi:hypothetical protein